MKNKMLRFLLTGILIFQAIGGAVFASEFSDVLLEENIEYLNESEQSDFSLFEDIGRADEIHVEGKTTFEEELITEEEFISEEETIIGEESVSEEEIIVEGELVSEEDMITEEDFLSENEMIAENEMSPDEYSFTLFSDDNAAMLSALDEESEELIDAVEDGEILAFTPVSFSEFDTSSSVMVATNEIASMAAIPDTTYRIFSGNPLYCDEVWTKENSTYPCIENGASYNDPRYRQCTVYRTIQYTDAKGKTRTSLMYCLEASKTGINGGESGTDVVEGALSLLNNSTMKKILYFGYGGPGDSCGDYDPTCSHVDWSLNANRFLFTHYALSKIYSGDLGFATEEEVEHIGLNRFISYMKTLTIPDRKAVKISALDLEGNTLTGTRLSVDLSLYPTAPENKINGLRDEFSNGYQITPLIKVSDEGEIGNGMILTSEESDEWQILYWKTEEEYTTSRGPDSPRILAAGKSVTLKDGGCFRIVFPEDMEGKATFTYEMSLYPMSFLVLNGETQKGGTGFQDMGTYVYQDTRGTVKLTVNAAGTGDVLIKKTCHYDRNAIGNVSFRLAAMQDIYSGLDLIYKKGTIIEQGKTDSNGEYLFENLIPGTYYLQEIEAAEGYLPDSDTYEVTVTKNNVVVQNIVNIPDLQGIVEIEKFVEGTKLRLKDAQFTIYSWNEANQSYSGTVYQMNYDENQKKYISPKLIYDEKNKGKFKIAESKNPQGYAGDWTKEIVLLKQSGIQKFAYKVENSLADAKVVEIQKVCADTGHALLGAQFTIYEYSMSQGAYKANGMVLEYDETKGKYITENLRVTDENAGKYKIVETKNPEGYTGSWTQEINILDIAQPLQFVVKNIPVIYPKGEVSVKKTDVLTGKILKDAEFSIYAWDVTTNTYLENPFDCIIMNYDSSKQLYCSGELEINPYNAGKYKIAESKNPDGYVGEWFQEIVLTEENSELHFDVTNDPEDLPLGMITVVKKIDESDITWAHGNPIFHFVIEGVDLQGKYHKYENYVRFSRNNYTVDSNGFASLNCNFTKIPLGTYQIYEKKVNRYYLKDIYANTSNVSITKLASPVYGANSKDTAYGQAKLSADNDKASITFVNDKKRFDDYSHNSVVKNIMPSLSLVAHE